MAWRDIVALSVIAPILSLGAVWAARHVGRWLMRSMSSSFGQVVLEVMAPDMAHLSTKVTASLDELRVTNTTDHTRVQTRLDGVDVRLVEVESRLAAVETKLNIRPPDLRTRATDQE